MKKVEGLISTLLLGIVIMIFVMSIVVSKIGGHKNVFTALHANRTYSNIEIEIAEKKIECPECQSTDIDYIRGKNLPLKCNDCGKHFKK